MGKTAGRTAGKTNGQNYWAELLGRTETTKLDIQNYNCDGYSASTAGCNHDRLQSRNIDSSARRTHYQQA
jgi:hypothetical protein